MCNFCQRLPPEWVTRYAELLPEQCTLEMPNGVRWPVQIKKKYSGLYFGNGWSDFVYRIHLSNGDFMNIIYVGDGVFHFDRYNFVSGCIPMGDFERESVYVADFFLVIFFFHIVISTMSQVEIHL